MTIQEIRFLLVVIILLIITFSVFYKITVLSIKRTEKINEQKNIEFMKKIEKFKF